MGKQILAVQQQQAEAGQPDADHADQLVEAAALGGFVLSLLAMLGLVAGSEVALGLLAMIGPGTAMFALSIAEALRLRRAQPEREALLAALFVRRRSCRSAG